jgi:hypothetical protein
MKRFTSPLTLLGGLGKRRAVARGSKGFSRAAFLGIVIGVLVFISSQTSSAHIDVLFPTATTAGGPAFTLRIMGTDLDDSDAQHIRFNSTLVAAILITPPDRAPEIQATIPASLIASAGTAHVTLDDFPDSLSFTINPPLTITANSPLPDGAVGQPYSQTLTRSGGTAPFTWSVASLPPGVNLPPGLNLDANSGVLSGIPAAAGTFTPILVSITDAAGVTSSKSFSIAIGAAGSCVYTISPTTETFPSSGGAGTISITAPPNCEWSASVRPSFPTFIRLTSADHGAGSGALSYAVSPIDNPENDPRSGIIDINRGSSSFLPIERSVTVTRETPNCPAEAYHISPTQAVHSSDSGNGGFQVTAPPGCTWRAFTSASWIDVTGVGPTTGETVGSVSYFFSQNTGHWRGSGISVAGKFFGVFQNDNLCPIDFFCSFFPSACGTTTTGTLAVARRFRDQVLTRSARGHHYTQLYYQFSSEAVQMMLLHPTLILRSREIFERYLPVVQAILKGEHPTLTEGDLAEIDGFLDSVAANGSSSLRDAVRSLSEDLRDPRVQAEFGLTVKAGPPRDVPAPSRSQSVKRFGSLLSPLGLFIVFAFGRRSRRSVATRRLTRRVAAQNKRIFFMSTALLFAGPWSAISGQSPAISRSPSFGRNQSSPADAPNKGSTNYRITESWSGESQRPHTLAANTALNYSTYFGGSGTDEGNGIAVDADGNIYVTGFTDSRNFPIANAVQPGFGGGQKDAFILKLNPAGTQVIYATYLGGGGQDNGTSIAVDAEGNAYVTGYTDSSDFPVRNALQPSKKGAVNAFVAKLNPTGSIVYSTLLGGSLSDYGSSIAVDPAGGVCVAGIATSPDFPLNGAAQPAFGGLADVFVAKLNSRGSRIVYSTYLGGAGTDAASSIAVDPAGSAYLTGITASPNFRIVNALQATHGGGLFDAFVTKLDAAGERVLYSTYLGGNGVDRAYRIAVDAAGSAYVIGDTDSTNFPMIRAVQAVPGGGADAFIAKLNASGTEIGYATYLGGSGIDGGTGIAVDPAGNATVTGFTSSVDFPLATPAQPVSGGGYDVFVTRFNSSGTVLDYSTYLGGAGTDAAFGVATTPAGSAYIMGVTNAADFPTIRALQATTGGGTADLFIAKISALPTVSGAMPDGKRLIVLGSGFDDGAKILIDGATQKTVNDSQSPLGVLIGKKAAKGIKPGTTVTLQVRNSDGALSNEFRYTRP